MGKCCLIVGAGSLSDKNKYCCCCWRTLCRDRSFGMIRDEERGAKEENDGLAYHLSDSARRVDEQARGGKTAVQTRNEMSRTVGMKQKEKDDERPCADFTTTKVVETSRNDRLLNTRRRRQGKARGWLLS
jgi:hypothetical protein